MLRLLAAASVVAGSVLFSVPTRATDTSASSVKAEAPLTLTVGSKRFTENDLLAEIMAQMLEHHLGAKVKRVFGLGGTAIAWQALESGLIDIYPGYTGTAWAVLLKETETVSDPLRTYSTVLHRMAQERDLHWLQPLGFNNTFALAMQGKQARALNVRSVSDLLPHASKLQAGFNPEFLKRHDGYPGLSKHYGLGFGDIRNLDHELAYRALDEGAVDVIETWTTDGKLLRFDITVLDDDRQFFPPYHAAPVVRGDLLRRHPEIAPILNRLAYRFPNAVMQRLNKKVEEALGDYGTVAREFLAEQGLVASSADAMGNNDETTDDRAGAHPQALAAQAPSEKSVASTLLAFAKQRAAPTWSLLLEHIGLVGASTLLAILLAVPLGTAMTRFPRLVNPVLGFAGVLQTIPSLALLVVLIPLFGLGSQSAICALFLYALLPIVRNTFTGIRQVDPTFVDAARGMGLLDRQILFLVELPLATRTIMAGIRTAAVINVGIATLGAFIGAGGLGEPIITGLQLNDMRLVLAGAVPAAVLSLGVDFGLSRIEKRLTRGHQQPG